MHEEADETWTDDEFVTGCGCNGVATGQIVIVGSAEDELRHFVNTTLKPRYANGHAVGQASPGGVDQFVAALQYFLNELWSYKPGQPGYLRVDGVLNKPTRELIRGFQLSYNVGPGDGSPTLETLVALQNEVADKHAMQARASTALHAARGDFDFVGDGAPPPDWSALAHGCPQGMWFDTLSGQCRPAGPLPDLPSLPPLHGVHGEFEPLGMSYDDWWITFGREAGMPYDPDGALPRLNPSDPSALAALQDSVGEALARQAGFTNQDITGW